MEDLKKNLIIFILIFFTFSFGGWLWELLYDFLKHGVIANHGVFLGPWLPIYGFGGLTIYIILNRFKKTPLLVFMGSFVFCTIIEYITGWYLETYKHHRWWSYSYMPFNIDGRICLLSSIFFGIMGLFGIYIFFPKLICFFKRFSFKNISIFALLLLSIFIIDFIHSIYYPNLVEKYKIIDTDKIGEIKLFKK